MLVSASSNPKAVNICFDYGLTLLDSLIFCSGAFESLIFRLCLDDFMLLSLADNLVRFMFSERLISERCTLDCLPFDLEFLDFFECFRDAGLVLTAPIFNLFNYLK